MNRAGVPKLKTTKHRNLVCLSPLIQAPSFQRATPGVPWLHKSCPKLPGLVFTTFGPEYGRQAYSILY